MVIFNYADDNLDDADRERGVARFSSTWYYTMEYMVNDKNNPWMARFRSFLDTYLGQLCCLVKLQDLNDVPLKFPNSGRRFLLTGEGCPAQVGHNDFDHRLGKGAGFFVMVTGAHPTGLWVCDGSHKNVNQSTRRKLQLADVMRMSLIQIPPNSVFIGHGFLQHAGAAWAGNHCLRYHMYLSPEGYELSDSVSFAYGKSLEKITGTASEDSQESSDRDGKHDIVEDHPGSEFSFGSDDENPDDNDDDDDHDFVGGANLIE